MKIRIICFLLLVFPGVVYANALLERCDPMAKLQFEQCVEDGLASAGALEHISTDERVTIELTDYP